MPITKVAVVGCGSFLGRRYLAQSRHRSNCVIVDRNDVRTGMFGSDISAVVNFALDPAYRTEDYRDAIDFDLRLARIAKQAGIDRYIMMSSRSVYDPRLWGPDESSATPGKDVYGRNKATTENRLSELLADRLTVLRLSNIFGYETLPDRRTFMTIMLTSLRTRGEVSLDINPDVRKDFLPDYRLTEIIDAILDDPPSGPLNVGAGQALPIGKLVGSLIEGYGQGKLRVTDSRVHDEFFLDTTRLKERYGFDVSTEEILSYCRQIGERLRSSEDHI